MALAVRQLEPPHNITLRVNPTRDGPNRARITDPSEDTLVTMKPIPLPIPDLVQSHDVAAGCDRVRQREGRVGNIYGCEYTRDPVKSVLMPVRRVPSADHLALVIDPRRIRKLGPGILEGVEVPALNRNPLLTPSAPTYDPTTSPLELIWKADDWRALGTWSAVNAPSRKT